jgi:hypothetical protein
VRLALLLRDHLHVHLFLFPHLLFHRCRLAASCKVAKRTREKKNNEEQETKKNKPVSLTRLSLEA